MHEEQICALVVADDDDDGAMTTLFDINYELFGGGFLSKG